MEVNGKHPIDTKTIEQVKPALFRNDELTDEGKIQKIQYHFTRILQTLGLDIDSDGLRDTPQRVARMYVNELCSGLSPDNLPEITLFDNTQRYKEMLIEKNITLYSLCEHHFLPMFGTVHVAYFPGDKIIGLSKLNRLVKFFASKPQVQEALTMEVAGALQQYLHTEHVAVYIQATHLCIAARGVHDKGSQAITTYYGGKFNMTSIRVEFLSAIHAK